METFEAQAFHQRIRRRFHRSAILGVGIHIATLFSINGQMADFEPGTPAFNQPPLASSGVETQASKPVTVQPLPAAAGFAQSPARKLSSEEIERLITLAREAMVEGNIDRARSALKWAAEAGNAAAALELGGTYDPVILFEIQEKRVWPQSAGVRPEIDPWVADLALAKVWYEKARDLGSTEATARLDRLNVPIPRRRPK
jgi:TPR repeat protein